MKKFALALSLFSLAVQSTDTQAQSCGFSFAFDQLDERGTTAVRVFQGGEAAAINDSRPLAFVIPDIKVNTDGTRISYHINDPRGSSRAINNIRNAYRDHSRPVSDFEAIRDSNWLPQNKVWQVLSSNIIEKDTRPGKEGLPCMDEAGFLVSMTADVATAGGWNRIGDCDQSKWIDSTTVPTFVLPRDSQFQTRGAKLRNVVVVMSLSQPRRVAFGVVGDIGPANELGEASIAMNRELNGLPPGALPANRRDAVERFQGPDSVILVLPGAENRIPRPITAERVTEFAQSSFDAWGGRTRLEHCLNEIYPEHQN